MVRTEPFFKKCCFCIPLQSCLQTWACIKVMTDVAVIVFLTILILLLSQYERSFKGFTLLHYFCVVVVLLVVDGAFMVFLSVGLCTKNVRSLNIFSYYSIYMVVTGAAFLVGFCIYAGIRINNFLNDALTISLVGCGIVNTGLDVAIIFTLKSEIIKLRNKQQFEFVTFRGEGKADLYQTDDEKHNV